MFIFSTEYSHSSLWFSFVFNQSKCQWAGQISYSTFHPSNHSSRHRIRLVPAADVLVPPAQQVNSKAVGIPHNKSRQSPTASATSAIVEEISTLAPLHVGPSVAYAWTTAIGLPWKHCYKSPCRPMRTERERQLDCFWRGRYRSLAYESKHHVNFGNLSPLQLGAADWNIMVRILRWRMGFQLSTLLRGKYTMLPTKDTDTEIHESSGDQSGVESAGTESIFPSLKTFHGRYLSRDTWVWLISSMAHLQANCQHHIS